MTQVQFGQRAKTQAQKTGLSRSDQRNDYGTIDLDYIAGKTAVNPDSKDTQFWEEVAAKNEPFKVTTERMISFGFALLVGFLFIYMFLDMKAPFHSISDTDYLMRTRVDVMADIIGTMLVLFPMILAMTFFSYLVAEYVYEQKLRRGIADLGVGIVWGLVLSFYYGLSNLGVSIFGSMIGAFAFWAYAGYPGFLNLNRKDHIANYYRENPSILLTLGAVMVLGLFQAITG